MKKLKSIIAGVLRIEPDTITEETTPAMVPSWDSFNALMLVSELESKYSVKFTMEEVQSVRCVGDIRRCLVKYGAEVNDAG